MSVKKEKNGVNFIILVVAISIGYAILRYQIKGDVPWKDLPVFILNKGISLAAITLLSLCISIRPLSNLGVQLFSSRQAKKVLGISGLLLTIAHVLLSFLIFNPSYFSVFFEEDGTLSSKGSLSLLAGVVGFMLVIIYHHCFGGVRAGKEKLIKIVTSKKFILGLLLLFGLHLFFMGYSNWMLPSNWQGGLPPISLISFVVVFLGLGINISGR
ncbi:hypothetical protein KCTC52924_02172 [Arenibacter antarcticus]|uniref:Sulfoxide reductase heme-binding subunit YedZ n=1 Tax=Arenibacter antarcticus TaxID=2040469 RepID=A0ABW5VGB8_9FLAO|nr:hypothetical protein [Arenibacter sp. H213]MCM4168595.1 hypothetical protein [Arenibacter sp. H213]